VVGNERSSGGDSRTAHTAKTELASVRGGGGQEIKASRDDETCILISDARRDIE
jgi:hypothetical protein